jgi:predicted nucleic acid-binding Zn ribbon protein
MKRSKTESLDQLIHVFLREQGLETPYNEYKLVNAWPEVVGDVISSYTGNIFIKSQVLHVEIKSPALRQELLMRRSLLKDKLNNHVGAQVITDITFH